MRAVVDTNVLVSALIRPQGGTGAVLRLLRESRFRLVLSEALLDELVDVLARPRLREKYGIDDAAVTILLRVLLLRGELVRPTEEIRLSRDPKDDMVLEAAVAGRANVVVTGDADLLDLERVEGVEILTPARFAERLEGR